MDISFQCGQCGQRIEVDQTAGVTEVPCPACGAKQAVPVVPARPKIRIRGVGATPTPAAAPPPATAITPPCPRCHQPLSIPDAVICLNCGHDLRGDQAEEPTVRSPSRVRLVIGVVAALVIIGSLYRLWLQFDNRSRRPQPRPTMTSGALSAETKSEARPAAHPVPADWQVTSWHVAATPVEWEQRPAIVVRVELAASLDDQVPGLWPGAALVELLRAPAGAGPYKAIQTVGEGKVTQPQRAVGGISTVNGVKQPHRNYQFTFQDDTVVPGTRYFYQVRFSDPQRTPLTTSGYCSTVALGLPAVTLADYELRWTAAALRTNDFLNPPRYLVTIPDVHDLARLPVAPGHFRLPTRGMMAVEFGVAGLTSVDEWESLHGQRERVDTVTLRRRFNAGRAVPGKQPELAQPEPPDRQGVFCKPGGDPSAIHYPGREAYFAPGAGLCRASWEAGDLRQLSLVEWQGHTDGTQRWTRVHDEINRSGRGERVTGPGVCERIGVLFVWPETRSIGVTNQLSPQHRTISYRTEATGGVTTARVELVQAPMPPALTAVAGDGQVTVSWSKIAYDPADWVDGPWLVLRRYSPEGVEPAGPNLQFQYAREILRGPATITRFTDHAVSNGVPYFYTLDISGLTRATSWSRATGPYECLLPVDVRTEVAAGQPPVVAVPQPPHDLRLAYVAEPNGWSGPDPRANVLQAHVLRTLRRTPWIQVLDRSVTPTLLTELQLRRLQSAAPVPVAGADAILRWRIRQQGYDRYFDLWLDDYQNQHKERVFSQRLDRLDLDQCAQQLIAALAQRFPAAANTAGRPAATASCSPIRTLAVTGFLPLSGVTLPAGAFDDLVAASLAQDGCLRVVERDQLAAALRELGLTKLTDQSSNVKLGKLLQADAIVSGFYQVSGDDLALTVRLIDAGTGEILNVFELTGSRAVLEALAGQVADQITTAAKHGQPRLDSPLLRRMEALSYRRNPFDATAAKTAAVVAPESPDHYFQLGQEAQSRGDFEEALGDYRTGLAAAEKSEDPWRFYAALGEVLARLDRTEELAKLWEQAVADRSRRQADPTTALYNLADSYQRLRRGPDAVAALSRIPIPQRTYTIAREFEGCGATNEAIAIYRQLVWPPALPMRGPADTLGAGYAALVRLCNNPAPAVRMAASQALLQTIAGRRPQQYQKLITELQRVGTTLPDLIASLPGATNPSTLAALPRAVLEQIIAASPGSIEAMRARAALANQLHAEGEDESAQAYLRELIAMKLQGQEPDQLRRVAQARLQQPPRNRSATAAADTTPRGELVAPLADGKLIVDASAVVYRVNPQGAVLWRFDPHARRSGLYGGPAKHWFNGNYNIDHYLPDLQVLARAMLLEGETLYAPNLFDGTLSAVDILSGQARWTFVAWAPITHPVRLDGKLWLGDSLGNAYELSPADGQVVRVLSYQADLIERRYDEQLLQLNVDAAHHRLSFINPQLTGDYRTAAGLRTFEFESHNFQVAEGKLEISDLSQIPHGQLPPNAEFDGGTVRLRDARLGVDSKVTTRTIQDKGARARAAAVAQARNLPQRELAVPALLELLDDQSESAALRSEAALSLSEICGTAFVPRLVQLTLDRKPEVRRAAVISLGRFGQSNQAATLRRRLQDRDPAVCAEAAAALVHVYGAQAQSALADLLQEHDSAIYPRLVLALVKSGDATAIPLLKETAADKTYLRDDDVLVTLCRAGDPDGDEELKRRCDLTNANMEPFTTAILIGTRLPEPRFGGYVRQAFAVGQRWGMQPMFAPALAAIGDPVAIPSLIGALPNAPIAMALEDLTGQSHGDNRARWDEWWRTAQRPTRNARLADAGN